MSYILDTNTWIALLRWQNQGVIFRLKRHQPDEILLCSVVLAELWFGAERSDAHRRVANHQVVDALAAQYSTLPFDNLAAREYASIRSELSSQGRLIGPNDMLIAAIARSRGGTLVSHNQAEFGRVPGLMIEDWVST